MVSGSAWNGSFSFAATAAVALSETSLPLVVIATIATVIASQAVISGAFSVTHQAVQLGFLPRLRIEHTSARAAGQIYVPVVNWGLLVMVVLLVLGFHQSSNLASAYGIAVSGTMVITTVMLAVLIPFTIIVIAAMPWVLYLVAPGFGDTPDRYQMALEMSRITFPYILLMSLTALMGGVMNSFDRFGPFAAAPMLFNACLMLSLAAFHYGQLGHTAGHAMAWGVLAAGVLQCGWLAWSCRHLGMILRLRRPALHRASR